MVVHGLLDAAFQGHRIGAAATARSAFAEDGEPATRWRWWCRRQQRRTGLRGDSSTATIGRHVLDAALQLDFLGHGHAVLGDGRRTEVLLRITLRPFGSEGHLHDVRQEVDAAEDRLPRLFSVTICFAIILFS